jgi:phosphomannomutase/phosphoglucomutase
MKKHYVKDIFREYDIRGVVDTDFTIEFAELLGRAFITYLMRNGAPKNPRVTIGQDARLSSPAISESLCKGMVAAGAQVSLLGLCTTPISYYSMFAMPDMSGGIMVTGSHNPPDYNGFKISVGKSTIFGDEIMKLYHIIESGDFVTSTQGRKENYDIFPQYLERYKKEFSGIKNIPVVVDCGNGAAGCIVRKMYEQVGLKPTFLFEEPDGRFPNHHPDPTVEKNMEFAKNAVLETKSKLAIGFDGDADRIGLLDHNGRFIMGDEMMMLISRAILLKNPGAKIIGDVKCSDRLYTDIRKHGGEAIMWKTGHSLIKNKIKEEHAPFGGELSGHIFFSDRNYGYDDAPYAGLRLIEILGETGKTIPELLQGMGSSFSTPEIRVDTTEEKKWSIVKTLRERFSKDTPDYKVNLIDGIRISFKNGWALARASNTQPVLVLRFEADSQATLDEIRGLIESIVNPLLK